ncbi:MAG TPA: ROK family protein [Anaerolineales bacterium]|nr:ROK family protein [Anaerolineales bacterium]
MNPLYAGLEAGGTKFNCIAATGPNDIRAEARFPTTTPAETLGRVIEFFRRVQAEHGPLAALGIGSFGPVDPNPASPTFGYITTTPKPGWAQADIVGPLRAALGLPTAFDTDVNAAALGEWRWGAAQGLDTFVYLTIGTGIGGGVFVNGQLVHGLIHPELGHILIPRDPARDPFPGFCPFHGDCLEGLAAGPAIERRWGARAETLPPDHPAWELEAHYLALGLVSYICTLSPQRIILGGGVMSQPQIFPLLRAETQSLLNGYIQAPQIIEHSDTYIVPPGLGARAGMLGAVALAENEYQKSA